ncbi:hypothetical protein LB561_03015 [Mesorhizobium sp. B292B1B]|uniref:hypothetical protein n=1 Tax=unclassified Mesorhizobium TaxID=325217 RepID=UPI00112C9A54|nr:MULTISPECIES: hypothetical protein [unclassified Mesorhizobium]MCA0010550.1 hypothetical protein [Mesorhizobium sp. B294B1A1]MCA0036256.1 hypothetical protein [Mesorhizobium sp. B292B1B]TPM49335.1 hypothetical protein FJ964_08200 [Mesorhizobium sp. B2-3-2]
MYLAVVVFLMGVFPVASILVETFAFHGDAGLVVLIGKWFVFWAVGTRLLLAGMRQMANPAFTADTIFGIKDKAAEVIVRELGFGNFAIGVLGAVSLLNRDWVVPAAMSGGLFYGLAGALHLHKGGRNTNENIAMISDLFIFVVLAFFLAATFVRPA